MIKKIVELSIRQRSLALAFAVGIILFGILELNNTRVENLPEFNAPFVEVQTEALGLSAYEVEQLITVPLEADLLNGVAFVEEISSQSMASLSSILMTFEPGTDILDARQLVQERLTQAAGLPNVSRAPAMVQPLSSEGRIMMIGLSSDELSVIDLGVLARWTIRPKILGLDGVANVVVWGQRERQLQVLADPQVLVEQEVSLEAVVRTTGNALWTTPLSFLRASTPGVGGFIDGPNQRIGIRHVPAISSPAHLATVAVDGRPDLVLGDVATIVEDHQPLIGDAVVNDGDGLYLIVEKFAWSNTRSTTDAVEAALAELEPGLVGVDVNTDLFRPASYLDRSVSNISVAALAGLILLALALLLLGSWRAAISVLVSVVVSVLATVTVLYALDVTVNTMLLAGLAIGTVLIIDNAVHNVQAVRRQPNGNSIGTVIGVRSNMTVFATAAVILAVALIPAFLMEGAAGQFVPDIAIAMSLSLAVAFVVGVTVTPALVSFLHPDKTGADPGGSSVLQSLGDRFENGLKRMMGATRTVVAAFASLILLGLVLTPIISNKFVPDFRQTDLIVSFDAAPGISLQETRRITSLAAAEVAELPGVDQVGIQVGRAVLSDEITNVDTSEIWLRMDPSADYDATFNQIREVVDGYPGFTRPFINTYANDQVSAALQTPTEDLVVRVYGENPEQLTNVTGDLVASIGGVAGVQNVRPLWPATEPSIEIEVDLQKAAEAQVKPGDVRRAAATLLSGIEVGSLFEEQKVFEVVVWSPPEVRNSVTSVENLIIDTPAGDKIALSSVATVRTAPNQRIIQRDAVSRYIDVVAEVPSRDIGAVEQDIRALVSSQGLPFEFHIGFLSTRDAESTNLRSVMAVALAAAITILLILQATFSSWRLAGLLVIGSLAALSGSAVAIVIAGGDYSIGSMAGLVAIAGLTLRSGIGLFKRFESLQLDEIEELGPDIVHKGTGQMFGPTVVSFLGVALVTVPLILAGNVAGLEVLGPFAIAVLGGIATSAFISLAVLPALYLSLARPAKYPELHLGKSDLDDMIAEHNTPQRTGA